MKHFPGCLLAGLMLFVPLCHAVVVDESTLHYPVIVIALGVALEFVASIIDVMALVWATLKCAGLFFIVSLLVLFCCRKYRWFKRQNSIWDKFTYLYYLYIPVLFVAFGAVYGASSNAEQQVSSLIKNELSPAVNQFLIGTLRDTPPEFYDLLANATPEDGVLILRKKIEDRLGEVLNDERAVVAGEVADKASGFWQKLPKGATTFVVDACVDIVYGKVADVIGLNRDEVKRGVKSIRKESFLDLMIQGGDLFGDYAAMKVAKVIASYRFFAMLVLILALFVPVSDFLLARSLKKTGARRNEEFPAGGGSLPEGPASP
ncbi:MAG: hypothetical protein LBP58_04550 [Azoarcus sp.]|jgi:hypothetical protein|nr:hypothetical protein [Azoarcus sp.]